MNDEAIIKDYTDNKKSITKIATEYNTYKDKVRKILLNNNIALRGNRTYTHTYNYFENIDTEDKAYWLGFILSDGYINVTKGYNVLGIEIERSDIDHLYKFKRDINATNPVKEYHKNSTYGEQDNCRISLSSKETISNLQSLGITSNKSYDGIFPTINNKLNNHLIRGYFDGNGCITINKYKSISMSFCGTKEILQNIELLSGFNWNWYQRHPEKDNNNYTIITGKQEETKNFLKYMYCDCNVYLTRKFKKYKSVISI